MKNFKRTKESSEGKHGYTYITGKDDLNIVDCCHDGWIKLLDLEPDPDLFGPIQVIKEWDCKKTKNCVGFICSQQEHLSQAFKYEFQASDYLVTRWQPVAGLPEGEL